MQRKNAQVLLWVLLITLIHCWAVLIILITESRLIFDNIKKTCCYAMTTDVPEIVPTILYIILSIPLGLYTISMILLNCVTDLMPAISLAFEGAENDIMRLPPRKPNERLISGNLLEAVYCQIGIIESVGAFYVYFVIYGACGWWPKSLIGIRADWEDGSIMDLPDSYGQEWNPSQRKNIEHVAQSGFFISVVMLNIFHLICRTCRRVSIFRKGLKNKMLYLAMFTESAIACFFVYTPVLRTAIGFDIVWPVWILAMIPFGLYLFTYDELRRLMIRKFPKSWWEKELYV